MASRKPAGAVSVPGNKPKASGAKAGAKPGAKAAGGAKAATGAKKAVGAGTVAKKVAAPAKKAAPGAKKGTTAGGGATSRLTKSAGGAKGKSSAGGVTAKKKAGVSKKAAAAAAALQGLGRTRRASPVNHTPHTTPQDTQSPLRHPKRGTARCQGAQSTRPGGWLPLALAAGERGGLWCAPCRRPPRPRAPCCP